MKNSIKQLFLTLIFLSSILFLTNPTAAYAETSPKVACVVTTISVTLNVDSGATIDEINADYGTTTLQGPLEGEVGGTYLLMLGSEQSPSVIVWQMQLDDRIATVQPNCDEENQTEGSPSYGW